MAGEIGRALRRVKRPRASITVDTRVEPARGVTRVR